MSVSELFKKALGSVFQIIVSYAKGGGLWVYKEFSSKI